MVRTELLYDAAGDTYGDVRRARVLESKSFHLEYHRLIAVRLLAEETVVSCVF